MMQPPRSVPADTQDSSINQALIVGREPALASLRAALEAVRSGKRRCVFLSGTAGLGKTTVLRSFLLEKAEAEGARLTWGECVEHYGSGEPYLPVLEAMTRLCRGPHGEAVVDVLAKYAPLWLCEMPGVLEPSQRERLRRQVQGATPERMLREITEALEVIAADGPMVLVIDDLHWSDHSTIELLDYLSRRRERAQLLLVGALRPVEGGSRLRAVVQDVLARGRGEQIDLAAFEPRVVGSYLERRFHGVAPSHGLVEGIHRRTGGHPLFLVRLVDYLQRARLLRGADGQLRLVEGSEALDKEVPANLRHLIVRQLDGLTPDQRKLLEVASLCGLELTAAEVAAGLEVELEAAERGCAELAGAGGFFESAGVEEWPDGTVSGRYRFAHALFRDAVYESVPEATRVRLHRSIARLKESAHAERRGEIAAQLAVHFEAGRELERAIACSLLAADVSAARHALGETIGHLERALDLLFRHDPDDAKSELAITTRLGTALMAARGYAAPEVLTRFSRARELGEQLGGAPELGAVVRGLISYHQVRAELRLAHSLGDQLLEKSASSSDVPLRVQAHYGHAATLFSEGELIGTMQHLGRALEVYEPTQHQDHEAVFGGYDPGPACLVWAAMTLWMLGYPASALHLAKQGLSVARQIEHPFSLAFAHYISGVVNQYVREPAAAIGHIEVALGIARREGFPFVAGMTRLSWLGAVLVREDPQRAVREIAEALDDYRQTGARLSLPILHGLYADALARSGAVGGAIEAVEKGLGYIEGSGEHIHQAELLRVRGELLLVAGGGAEDEAERCFRRAIEIAQRQQALSWELRAITSLARLRPESTSDLAHLGECYAAFEEGSDTGDLRDARALLESRGATVREPKSSPRGGLIATSRELIERRARELTERRIEPRSHTPSRPFTVAMVGEAPEQRFQCQGDYWTIGFDGAVFRLKDMRGLGYVARLLSTPHQEIHALDLVAATSDEAAAKTTRRLAAVSTDPAIDDQARAQYDARLAEIRDELAEAEANNDRGRIEALQQEQEFIEKEIRRAYGLGGRKRKPGSPAEKARVNVTRSIKKALERIEKEHPGLGAHLRNAVRTGTFCVYAPDPRISNTWLL